MRHIQRQIVWIEWLNGGSAVGYIVPASRLNPSQGYVSRVFHFSLVSLPLEVVQLIYPSMCIKVKGIRKRAYTKRFNQCNLFAPIPKDAHFHGSTGLHKLYVVTKGYNHIHTHITVSMVSCVRAWDFLTHRHAIPEVRIPAVAGTIVGGGK